MFDFVSKLLFTTILIVGVTSKSINLAPETPIQESEEVAVFKPGKANGGVTSKSINYPIQFPSQESGKEYVFNTWNTDGNWPLRTNFPPFPTFPTFPTFPSFPTFPTFPTWPTRPTWPSFPTWPTLPTWPTFPTQKPTESHFKSVVKVIGKKVEGSFEINNSQTINVFGKKQAEISSNFIYPYRTFTNEPTISQIVVSQYIDKDATTNVTVVDGGVGYNYVKLNIVASNSTTLIYNIIVNGVNSTSNYA